MMRELSEGNLWSSFFPPNQWKEDVNVPFEQFPKDNMTYSQNKSNLHFPFLHFVLDPSGCKITPWYHLVHMQK